MLDWSSCPAVECDPDRVSGAWVFRGTRVPVKALFENLESGARIDDFLSWFPGVSREMAVAELTDRSALRTMRVLFDQGTPVPLRCFLGSHTITTVFEKGWSGTETVICF